MLKTASSKKRVVGLLLFAAILVLFVSLNRFPKLDAVGGDLDAVTAPEVQCFQGFCIERDPGTTFVSRWWVFSVSYLRLVAIGMVFAFVVAGLAESFLFPSRSDRSYPSGSVFKRTLEGAVAGPVMNLCSACIVPVSVAFQRRGGVEGALAMVQGSATLNIPALAMVFFVFTPLLGLSRLLLALVGALFIGPIVVMAVRGRTREPPVLEDHLSIPVAEAEASGWRPVLAEAFREWAKTTFRYAVRMGPVMVVAGFASGLAIQWVSPETVSSYLGNDILGVIIAATFGILINVPLLFEIPLVALLLLLGMGTAPAATLLFTAAAGGPVTFWGLARMMPKKAIAAFASATWTLGLLGGMSVLAIGAFIWEDAPGLRIAAPSATATEPTAVMVTEHPSFRDVTLESGVDFQHGEDREVFFPLGGGAVVLDFNGDGFDDIYAVNSKGPNSLFRNDGDGTFTDVARAAGADDPSGAGNGGCAADYDNDGDVDIFVTNYGPSKLLSNNGDGTFADVTADAGVQDPGDAFRSTGCAWGDYDLDGSLDLIVLRHLYEHNQAMFTTRDFAEGIGGLVLYHNNGDGTFGDDTALLGDISGPRMGQFDQLGNIWGAGFQPGWSDLDNDGDLDLYVVNDLGNDIQSNVLWRNDGSARDGSWSFTDVSLGSGADRKMFGMGLAVADYDLDGFLDLFVTNIKNNVLLRNRGSGLKFTDVAKEAGVRIGTIDRKVRVAWGAVFFDYDNDGDEDLYVVSGYLRADVAGINAAANPNEQPNVLLRNERDGTFVVVSNSGADDPGVGRGGVYLDYDNDGCLDLFVVNLGQAAKLLRNSCESASNWLIVKPVGTSGSGDAVGARITVEAGGKAQIREVTAGSSQMGQNMLAAHFGLGQADSVDSVTVKWPSGKVQTLTNVAANQHLVVVE